MHTRRVRGLAARLLVAAIVLTGSARAQIAGENVNMVSGTQWPGGDPFLQRQNEPTMAISSANPQHLMAGANDYRSVDVPDPAYGRMVAGDSWMGVFKSLDGGQTWRSVLLSGYPQECKAIAAQNATLPASAQIPLPTLCGFPATADPVMRAGTDGIFYLAGINFLRDKSASRLFIARFIDDNNKENGDAARLDPASPVRVAPTDPIRHIDTVEVYSSARYAAANPTAPLMFMDKPWIAVDVPRNQGLTCSFKTASGASILAGTVYMSWTQFYQTGVAGTDDYQSDVMLSWSSDCGKTWTTPVKLNTPNSTANQGVAIAVEPITGRVYVAWRRGRWPADTTVTAKQTDAIMVTRSEGRKKQFAAPRAIAKVIPFDMGSASGKARTQTMPTMAISSDGASSWAHLAWSSRSAANADARIYVTTAKIHPRPAGDDDQDDPEDLDDETRVMWSPPAIADPTVVSDDVGNVFTRGHQYMPALTFGQGRLMLVYYDTRLDHTLRLYRPITPSNGKFYEEELVRAGDLADAGGANAVFTPTVDDYAVPVGGRAHPWRHTIDVRVASLPWGAQTAAGGTLVSRFPFGLRGSWGMLEWLTDIGWLTLPGVDLKSPSTQQLLPSVVGPYPFGGGAVQVPYLQKETATGYEGQLRLEREQQLQMNVPGFPMFKGGTVAFLGDYIDIQGQAFTPKPGGWWAFNTAPTPAPVFHAVWTSNQDVRTPTSGDWTRYTPVTALINPNRAADPLFDGGRSGTVKTVVDACVPDDAGSRDQNIYTSRITEGLAVSSPQNVKLIAYGSPTTFVIAARNETPTAMTVRLFATPASPVAFPPAASTAVDISFTPSFGSPLTALCATIAPFGSVSRTLFAQLRQPLGDASTTLYVQAEEVTACDARHVDLAVPTGRSGSVTLNPPAALNALVTPDGAMTSPLAGETVTVSIAAPTMSNPNSAPTMSNPTMSNPTMSNPTMSNPGLMNPTMSNPTMSNPTMSNPTMSNPTMSNPSMSNPTMSNPTMSNPTMSNPALMNPTMSNPTMSNPTMSNPTMSNPTMSNPTMSNPSMSNPTMSNPTMSNPTMSNPTMSNPTMSNPTMSNSTLSDSLPWDSNQTITNGGNTTASYHVKLVGTGVDPNVPLQLILSKTYLTLTSVECALRPVPHDQVVVSVPDAQKAVVDPNSPVDPGASDASLSNATISLAPGESATITLRGFMKQAKLAETVGRIQPVPVPAAVAPQPNVTYRSYQPASGQTSFLKAATITTLTAAGLDLSATVAKDPSWAYTPSVGPSGNVSFIVDGKIAGSAALSGGSAAFVVNPNLLAPSPGSPSVFTAVYLGDASYAPSTSAAVSAPPPAPATIDAVSFASTVVPLNGSVPYTATFTNHTASLLPDIVLQGWIEQGTARRAAGGLAVLCGSGIRDLPPGTCSLGFSLSASNAAAGTGTLAPGSATAVFELKVQPATGPEVVLDTYRAPITLTSVVVTVAPASVSSSPGGTQAFTATVTGTAATAVTWSVREPGCGTVDGSGLYTAPAAVPAGSCTVVATSSADPTATGTATVAVALPALAVTGVINSDGWVDIYVRQGFFGPGIANATVTINGFPLTPQGVGFYRNPTNDVSWWTGGALTIQVSSGAQSATGSVPVRTVPTVLSPAQFSSSSASTFFVAGWTASVPAPDHYVIDGICGPGAGTYVCGGPSWAGTIAGGATSAAVPANTLPANETIHMFVRAVDSAVMTGDVATGSTVQVNANSAPQTFFTVP